MLDSAVFAARRANNEVLRLRDDSGGFWKICSRKRLPGQSHGKKPPARPRRPSNDEIYQMIRRFHP
jgi:hypothetical protein